MTPTVRPQQAVVDLQRELEQVRALYRLMAALARAPGLEVIHEEALTCFEAGLETTRSAVLLYDEAGVMRFVAWHRLSDRYRAVVEGHSPWTRESRDPAPIAVPDTRGDPALAGYGSLFELEGIRGLLFVPITYGGVLLGKLMAYFERPRAPSQRELEFVETVARHIAVAVDRARADEELRRSRDELREILANVADAVTVQAPSGKLVFANEAAARLSGHATVAGLLASSPGELFSRFELQGEPATLEQLPNRVALREGRPASSTVRFRVRATGEERWSQVSSTPLLDGAGRVRLAVNVIRDVTDQRRAEVSARFLADASALLASSLDQTATLETLVRLAVPHIADWCGVELLLGDDVDATQHALAHHDPAKLELARELRERYPPDRAAPRGAWQVIRTGVAELHAEVSRELLVAGARDPEHLALLEQLSLRSAMVVPLRARGRTIGALTFILSDTPRRYGPSDLAMAQDLAGRAALAIDNARLFGEVRRADERKNEFLAMLGHELRNPLAPIVTASHLARVRQDQPGQVVRALDVIDRQVVHMERIVDDLLDVSRIERGKLELRKEPLDLVALARTTTEDYRPSAAASGLDLAFEAALPSLPVLGDPTRLAQVLGNLLVNGLRFTEPGGRVSVRVERQGDEAALVVRDTGIGMTPELIELIFVPFVQAERSLARTRGGLGLGLAVARGLLALHGGRITASSDGLGRGSEIVARLPVAREVDLAAPATAPWSDGTSRRVLVVEDNADARETLAVLLASYGHEVEVAGDGAAALEAARRFHPDVVLCDLGLPVLDGYEVATRLRAEPGPTPRLVALSGYAQAADRERARAAGFDEHLRKPAGVADVLRLLARNVP